MKFKVRKSVLNGEIAIPPSKSHTLRGAVLAGLARGRSVLHGPLSSADTLACAESLRLLGAKVEISDKEWIIEGFSGKPLIPDAPLDVKNSGTTMNFLSAVASLGEGEIELTGDESIRRRPVAPLLRALRMLGAARADSFENSGCPPVTVRGRLIGGSASVEGVSSQYVSALLLIAPLLRKSTQLKVVRLYEKPYIDMTLAWLRKMGIEYTKQGRNNFDIPGGQTYYGFETAIPADFSTATFPLAAAAIAPGSSVLIRGLDPADTQGDKRVFDVVREMGGSVAPEDAGIRVAAAPLEGLEIDLNEIPDALPALAVLGCFAEGETRLVNVAQARIKETDRIKVMHDELKKMGADIEELKDGLVIRKSALTGTEVDGHSDHRVVMALAIAGLAAEGETVVTTADTVGVTFPGFYSSMKALGADIEEI